MGLMLLVMASVLVWFMWFILRQCTPVHAHQMIALMSLIFMCLVFFTLYEQTYGSWCTFTDRLLTKDIMPSMVIHEGKQWPCVDGLAGDGAGIVHVFGVVVRPLSEIKPAEMLFVSAFVLMMVFLARDMVVLPQNASSLTYLSGPFSWRWHRSSPCCGVAGSSRPQSVEAGQERDWLDVRRPVVHPLAFAAQQGRSYRHAGQRLVAGADLRRDGSRRDVPVAGGLVGGDAIVGAAVVSLMMGTWFLATAFRKRWRRRSANWRRSTRSCLPAVCWSSIGGLGVGREQIRAVVLEVDVCRRRLQRSSLHRLAADPARNAWREIELPVRKHRKENGTSREVPFFLVDA
jgi:POT family proton-dependent oligopeptide transporter